jgi:tripartite-type tricarboxylate transporter receptor subunit TctC
VKYPFILHPSAFLLLLLGAIAPPLAIAAQQYPVRPIRMVVASVTGSAPDIIARHLAVKLTEAWGQQIVVDTRPGASGIIGAETTAKAAPDGYTLWLGTQTQLISTLLQGKYAMAREFAPVGFVATTTFVLVASAAVPAKTLAEFIDFAKARPGRLFYSTGGEGSSGHLCVELLRRMTGMDLVHVPYKASPLSITDMMAGQIHLSCVAVPALPSYVKSGKIRALAITSAERTPLAPGLPVAAEAVPGYELKGWYGLLAPRGTPAEIVSRINAAVVAALKDPAFQERLIVLGAEAAPSTPAEFAAMLRRETARWEKLLKEIGVRPAQ